MASLPTVPTVRISQRASSSCSECARRVRRPFLRLLILLAGDRGNDLRVDDVRRCGCRGKLWTGMVQR